MRGRKYNKGQWELQRERLRLPPSDPPAEDDVHAVSHVVEGVLRSWGLESRLREQEIAECWRDIVGPQIAAHTHPGKLEDQVLTVYVSHPVWLFELERWHKETILERLRQRFASLHVRDLRFRISPDTLKSKKPS